MNNIATILSLTIMFISITESDVNAQQVIPPGQLVLAGKPVFCGSIPTLIQPIPDIAMAQPGWIILHPAINSYPPIIQLFFYAHECGHHMVGINEADADCWAIQVGRDQDWFNEGDFNMMILFFHNNPGDSTHAPGLFRLEHMISCYFS